MSYFGDCTRVYLRRGAMAHLLSPNDSANSGCATALCRLQPRWGTYWYGTGSQYEYEIAARLPLCPRCAREAGQAIL